MKYWFRNLRNKIAKDDRRHYTAQEVNKKARNQEILPTHIVLHSDGYEAQLNDVYAPEVTFETKTRVSFEKVDAKKLILKDPRNPEKIFFSSDSIHNSRLNEIISNKKNSYLSITNIENLETITATGKGKIYLSNLKMLKHLYLDNLEEIESIYIHDAPNLESTGNSTVIHPDLEETFYGNMFEYLFPPDLQQKRKYKTAITLSNKSDICFMDHYKGTKQGLVALFEDQNNTAKNTQCTQDSIDEEYQKNLADLNEKYQQKTAERAELAQRTEHNILNVTSALKL